jgi:flavin reductase (DIM6/NTAB) family NADH-FMN oxidoreductase RutF
VKVSLGVRNCLYPMPTTLVGANVDGKPAFITMAHVGILDYTTISLGMNKAHFTNTGIRENGAFSVNIPSQDMLRVTDYCGCVTGRKVDKGALFTVFYGSLGTAPMIQECPVNMECRLLQVIDRPNHDVFIGEIVESHCEETALSGGVVDFAKVQPLLFVMNDKSYWQLGERLGRAWSVGKDYR